MVNTLEVQTESAELAAMRRYVCSVCLDQRNDGTCSLSDRSCAIEVQLPAIKTAIADIRSNSMEPYYRAIESQVCPRCAEQGADGTCTLREQASCALYSYLSLVANAVDEATAAPF